MVYKNKRKSNKDFLRKLKKKREFKGREQPTVFWKEVDKCKREVQYM